MADKEPSPHALIKYPDEQYNNYSTMSKRDKHNSPHSESTTSDNDIIVGASAPTKSALSIASHGDIGINIERHVSWSQIIGGSVGNVLEWYDFAVFGYLASELSTNFFPKQSKTARVWFNNNKTRYLIFDIIYN